MAGTFDRFRFDAKRKRDEMASDPPNVESNEEDAETLAVNGFAKRDKKNNNATELKRECFSQESSSRSGKWQERWHAICDDCFEHAQSCEHYPEHRLRLLIVGHNPSDHAWKTGYSYSNPTNRMWMMLTGNTFASIGGWHRAIDSYDCRAKHFAARSRSWLHIAWSEARKRRFKIRQGNKYDRHTCSACSLRRESDPSVLLVEAWRDSFFLRLRHHAAQVCLCDHDIATESATEHIDDGESTKCQLAHAPMLIAFSGKRQFSWLFSPPLAKIESYGRQSRFPPGWPQELQADSEIWVLPSSSGRAAMTTVQRVLPYQQLAERVHRIPWTRSAARDL